MEYDHQRIEAKWQKKWEEAGIYRAEFPSKKKKYYLLIEFPYPSGERLHVGHARSYSALDALARKRRMQGFNVLYPIGWDAFGLPAENYAIKTGIHPLITTKENIANAKKQAKSWGLSFDWSREINTSDPDYYKWTQWIFVQLFKQELAYRAEIPVNWCPSCKINLANEEVIDGRCERCGAATQRRMQKQWMLKITAYAQRLLDDLETVDYREDIKQQQVNWIGKKEGVVVQFSIFPSTIRYGAGNFQFSISVFTTRLDTLYGVTALVVAPDKMIEIEGKNKHLALEIASKEQYQKVTKYIKESQKISELERTELKEKTGVFTGAYAVNPINGERIPVWVADYVVGWYGKGAIMLVPAHDERDFEFAKKYGIEIREVVSQLRKDSPFKFERTVLVKKRKKKKAFVFVEDGILVNSGKYTGLTSEEAREKMLEDGQKAGWAKSKTTYKLRDWVFSRQHYWGEPIPMIFCARCAKNHVQGSPPKAEPCPPAGAAPLAEGLRAQKGNTNTTGQEGVNYRSSKSERIVTTSQENNSRGGKIEKKWDSAGWFPVSEEELPVELPFVKRYEPTDTGESPLANVSDWVKVKCPQCGGEAQRETDTMPNWAGSSWYFLRYCDTKNNSSLAGKVELEYWLPVDWYNGGLEHTTLHLLYSRFWHKFLYDLRVVPTSEPYAKRTSHGVVVGSDGQKMSKSRGNVINPDDIVEKCGADAFRMYEMFMGPFEEQVVWSDAALSGMKRFLQRVHRLYQLSESQKDSPFEFKRTVLVKLRRKLHQTIKKVSEDIEELKFNTAIAALMEFVNEVYKFQLKAEEKETFLLLLAPFAPHLSEELYQNLPRTLNPCPERSRRVEPRTQKFTSIHQQPWPEYDPELVEEEMIEFVIQVNGKVRATFAVNSQQSTVDSVMEKKARENEKVRKYLAEKKIKKTIFIPRKLINFVV